MAVATEQTQASRLDELLTMLGEGQRIVNIVADGHEYRGRIFSRCGGWVYIEIVLIGDETSHSMAYVRQDAITGIRASYERRAA